MKKKKNTISILSNIAFVIGLLLFIYYIYSFLSTRMTLPAGVCPFDQARPFAFAASTFLILSLVLSFFEVKKQRKSNIEADKSEDSKE
ncbi:MAG: hypothetical protein AB1Z19_01980 [Eubacteriales bacterium]